MKATQLPRSWRTRQMANTRKTLHAMQFALWCLIISCAFRYAQGLLR
jgi:hypothetical protein